MEGMKTNRFTFSDAAAQNIKETGADPTADLAALLIGAQTIEGLLAHCLDGADPDREQGWRDYVSHLSERLSDLGAPEPAWDWSQVPH